ncbi:cytochrome B [Aureimonas flava]|uniref:Cytochrome B n=2 Tax=Aureimonas flava TaxID=2320271 RepID=A0A3A1WKC6_9HYPH|nr:cytochrome B [Aureimonas flava]
MVMGWGVLLPLGMIVARFFKIVRASDWPATLDRKFWWHAHLTFQIAGIGVMTLGLLLAYGRGEGASELARLHHLVGWTVVLMGWSQVLGGLLRGTKGGPTGTTIRGDHYDMTLRRVVFEYLHKFGGWATLPLVVVTTTIGLVMVDAPRWMPLLIGGWWGGLALAFVLLQRQGCCIDTYQAIWGPEPVHPGNARMPIGWRVTRR